MELRVAEKGIVDESIVDGPGLRLVVFTQGCPHRCPGCHNPHTHALDGGVLMDTADIGRRFTANPMLAGITFSGGEPFLQAAPLCGLARLVHSAGKTVVTYTGFTYEELVEQADDPVIAELLDLTDLLVDGPFIADLKDLTMLFCGSRNQRLLTRDDRKRLAPVSYPLQASPVSQALRL